MLFPVIIIWKPNMSLRQNIAIGVLMGMSLVTTIASIMKVVASASRPDETADVQYNSSLEALWTSMEQSFVVIMGCIPALGTLVQMDFTFANSSRSSIAPLVGGRPESSCQTEKETGTDTTSSPESNCQTEKETSTDTTSPDSGFTDWSPYYEMEVKSHQVARLGGCRESTATAATDTEFMYFRDGRGLGIMNNGGDLPRMNMFDVIYGSRDL